MRNSNAEIAISYWIGYFLFICFFFYFDTIDQYRNSEKIKAEVVDRLMTLGHKGRWYYYPQLKFVYNDSIYLFGDPHTSLPGRHNIGDKRTVIFPKGDPDKAEIYSFFPYWVSLTKLFFSFMITLFLFMMVVFSGWYAEFKRKYKNR